MSDQTFQQPSLIIKGKVDNIIVYDCGYILAQISLKLKEGNAKINQISEKQLNVRKTLNLINYLKKKKFRGVFLFFNVLLISFFDDTTHVLLHQLYRSTKID